MAAVLLGVLVPAPPASAGTDVATGLTSNEPHNANVNPRNPAQVAVGRGCTVLLSNDFGRTFPVTRQSTLNCRGDISLAYDSAGRLFTTHLTGSELVVMAGEIVDTTTPGTQSFTPVQVSTSGDGVSDDKQWLVADSSATSPYRDNLYLVWTALGSPSRIQFSRSTDSGQTWSAPSNLSADGEGFVWPSHLAVGPNGDLYVAYHTDTCGALGGLGGTVPLLKDGSGGAGFAAGQVQQKTTAFGLGQATVTCNVQDSSGDEIPGTDFWLQGTVQPWILPDPARPGSVYVVANDDPDNVFGMNDDADVVLARSTDDGATFTRSRIDHAPGQSFQVLPTAHIDQDGNIVVHWYDNRRGARNGGTGPNGNDNFLLDVYGTTSRDAGLSFVSDFRISDSAFDPDVNAPCRFGTAAGCGTNNGSAEQTLRIGEYNGLWSVNGIGYATWTGNTTPPSGSTPASGSQTIYFDVFSMLGAFPDAYEPNESADFAVATTLGSDDTFNANRLTLHSATDADVFRLVARHTGTLKALVAFNDVVVPGLQLTALDRLAQPVAVGVTRTVKPGSAVQELSIPVVEGQTYFIEVLNPEGASGTPPQSTFDLTVVNRRAPEPFGLDLLAAADSGRSDQDDVTNVAGAAVRLQLEDAPLLRDGLTFSPQNGTTDIRDDAPGFKVAVERNGSLAGWATPVAGEPGIYGLTLAAGGELVEGRNALTAAVVIIDPSDDPAVDGTAHETGRGPVSAHSLVIALDRQAPATADAVDLLASSDSGGVAVDDITTVTTPTFQGSGEPNALVRLRANGASVGSDLVTSAGAYRVTAEALADGVYDVAVVLEDLAGNASTPSSPLPVTIAHHSLSLTGAVDLVRLDLGAATVVGYPGVPGGVVGLRGIPQVHLDAAGQQMQVTGSSGDDRLTVSPRTADGSRLVLDGSSQVIDVTAVASPMSLALAQGDDELVVKGTTGADSITAGVSSTTDISIGSLLGLRFPTAETERLRLAAGSGADTTEVTVFDDVSTTLTLDSAEPVVIKNSGDSLLVRAGSPRAKLQTIPGGSDGASGSVVVSYPQSTGHSTRIDYIGTERVSTAK